MNKRHYLHIGAALLFCWFSAAVLFKAFQEPLAYDDAYNAAVSRNVAEGKGWVTDYHTPIPFNSTVTSGPSLLLPAAALIRIFGAQLWIPPTTNALLMLSTLLIAGLALNRLLDRTASYLAATFTSLAFFSLYTHRVWSEFAGDGFIATAIIAASALTASVLERRIKAWAAAAAGALLALALLSKLYGLISTLGLVAALLWQIGRTWLHHPSWSLGRTPGLMAAGASGILLPWFAYKTTVMGALPEQIRAQRTAFADDFFKRFGSGVEGLTNVDSLLPHVWVGVQRNFHGLAHSLSQNAILANICLAALICVPLISGLILACRRELKNGYLFIFLLAGAASAHWLWYICISPGDIRYARIPILLSCLMIALLLSIPFRGILALVAVAMVAIMLTSTKREDFLQFALFKSDTSMTLTTQKNFIRAASLAGTNEPLIGCNWAVSRLLDYAAPDDIQLKDLALILRGAATDSSEKNPFQAIELTQPIYVRFATSGAEWGFGRYIGACPIPDFVENVCKEVLFSEGFYFIKRCAIHSIPTDVADTLRNSRFNHLSGMQQ